MVIEDKSTPTPPPTRDSLPTMDQEKLDKVDKAYSSEPWWYDIRGFFILTFAYRGTIQQQVRLFGNNMGPKHLEGALGTGTLLGIILKWRRFKRMPEVAITGFDYAERMLAGARHRFKKEKQISLLRADVAHLPFDSDHFDTANIANSIHCFPDIDSGLKEVRRVLKPAGTLAGNVLLYPKGNGIMARIANRINTWGMKKGILHKPHEPDEIHGKLIQCGYQIVHEKITGNCYDFIARKP